MTELITYNYYVGQTGMEEDDMSLRKAVWYYVQLLFGITYDFYDYQEVNQMLTIPAKTYIKKVACFPHLVSEDDVNVIMQHLLLSSKEILHISFLVIEAKRECELLYFARALKGYLDSLNS